MTSMFVKYTVQHALSIIVIRRCKCGNCGIQLLSNSYECLCCIELDGCEEAMKSEEVVADLKAEGNADAKCITQHPGFGPCCLQKWSLKLASRHYKTRSKAKYCQLEGENRYTSWSKNSSTLLH